MVTTKYFAISPSKYIGAAMGVWFSHYWWVVGLPLGACVLYGLHDWRFLIVALALTLVGMPAIVMLVYFNYALRAEVALGVLLHRITFSAASIDIEYAPTDDRPAPPLRHLQSTEIAGVEDSGQSLRITLKSSKYDIIEVPASAFSAGDFAKTLKILQDLL